MLIRSASTRASTIDEKINPLVHLLMEDNLPLVYYTFSRNENTVGSSWRRLAFAGEMHGLHPHTRLHPGRLVV
jgi:hypothetical protein